MVRAQNEDNHTNIPSECEQQLIQELAELADHEYYMLGMGPDFGAGENPDPDRRRGRYVRGRARMLETIAQMRELQSRLKCKACLMELSKQIQLQTQGLREIERAWGIERE
jgi:hypothetical protein